MSVKQTRILSGTRIVLCMFPARLLLPLLTIDPNVWLRGVGSTTCNPLSDLEIAVYDRNSRMLGRDSLEGSVSTRSDFLRFSHFPLGLPAKVLFNSSDHHLTC